MNKSYLLVLLLILWLTGCTLDTKVNITLYEQEYFTIVAEMTIPTTLLEMNGGVTPFESNLDQEMATYQAETGASEAQWKRGESDDPANTVYIIELQGTGFEQGTQPVARAIEHNGQPALLFEGTSFRDLQGMGSNLTVTLQGGEILESNGTQIGDDTVRWINPTGPLYAVLIPKSRFPLQLAIVLGVAVVGGLGGMAIAVKVIRWHRRREIDSYDQEYDSGYTALPATAYCPTCGETVERGTTFCIHCGSSIPASK